MVFWLLSDLYPRPHYLYQGSSLWADICQRLIQREIIKHHVKFVYHIFNLVSHLCLKSKIGKKYVKTDKDSKINARKVASFCNIVDNVTMPVQNALLPFKIHCYRL